MSHGRREVGCKAHTQQEIAGARVRGGKAGRFPREFACRAAQTALPLSLLRHDRAEQREQDYPAADRRRETLQSARSRLPHLVTGPLASLADIMELLLFSSSLLLRLGQKKGTGSNGRDVTGSRCF